MSYFDPSKDTELVVDASPVGLGAILFQMQNRQKCIIAYASHALTDVENRYSQTEREASNYCMELWALSLVPLWSFFYSSNRPQAPRTDME